MGLPSLPTIVFPSSVSLYCPPIPSVRVYIPSPLAFSESGAGGSSTGVVGVPPASAASAAAFAASSLFLLSSAAKPSACSCRILALSSASSTFSGSSDLESSLLLMWSFLAAISAGDRPSSVSSFTAVRLSFCSFSSCAASALRLFAASLLTSFFAKSEISAPASTSPSIALPNSFAVPVDLIRSVAVLSTASCCKSFTLAFVRSTKRFLDFGSLTSSSNAREALFLSLVSVFMVSSFSATTALCTPCNSSSAIF